jgi:hypothetical protein
MNSSDAAERIESLKAGLIGGSTAAIGHVLILGLFTLAGLPFPAAFNDELMIAGLQGAIAFFTGFLFGVTYRYIIRQDSNPQLKAGGGLAFGLARGLAQVEGALRLEAAWLTVAVQVAESVGMIAIAALSLEWSIGQGWLKPFGKG